LGERIGSPECTHLIRAHMHTRIESIAPLIINDFREVRIVAGKAVDVLSYKGNNKCPP
jgi:hypothetical protein